MIEVNARFADPESMNILSLFRGDTLSGKRVGVRKVYTFSPSFLLCSVMSLSVDYLTDFQGKFEFHPAVKATDDPSFEIFVSDQMRYQRGVADKGKFTLEKPIVKIKNELVVATPNKTPRIQGKIRFP